MKKFKENYIENLLCIFIIISPILDMASYLFRNYFQTSLSPATILRPIIPIAIILIIFFTDKKKKELFIVGVIYTLYALIHIILFSKVKTGISFGRNYKRTPIYS